MVRGRATFIVIDGLLKEPQDLKTIDSIVGFVSSNMALLRSNQMFQQTIADRVANSEDCEIHLS
jgi:hypothetical protein